MVGRRAEWQLACVQKRPVVRTSYGAQSILLQIFRDAFREGRLAPDHHVIAYPFLRYIQSYGSWLDVV